MSRIVKSQTNSAAYRTVWRPRNLINRKLITGSWFVDYRKPPVLRLIDTIFKVTCFVFAYLLPFSALNNFYKNEEIKRCLWKLSMCYCIEWQQKLKGKIRVTVNGVLIFIIGIYGPVASAISSVIAIVWTIARTISCISTTHYSMISSRNRNSRVNRRCD